MDFGASDTLLIFIASIHNLVLFVFICFPTLAHGGNLVFRGIFEALIPYFVFRM